MYRELERSIGELRVNHTDKEIAGAFSEYFQIVKSVSHDYTDVATVAELRADHPELSFMDDDEIEEILEQAKVMRHKREAPKEERLTEGDIEELLGRNPGWLDVEADDQGYWIREVAGSASIEALAGMIWVCTGPAETTVDHIEETMREYLKEKREKERGSIAWSTDGYDVEFAEECIKAHMGTFEDWPYGNVKKIETDQDGDLRIHYGDGMYWHYREEDGGIIWW